jgi:hypothetical protein
MIVIVERALPSMYVPSTLALMLPLLALKVTSFVASGLIETLSSR